MKNRFLILALLFLCPSTLFPQPSPAKQTDPTASEKAEQKIASLPQIQAHSYDFDDNVFITQAGIMVWNNDKKREEGISTADWALIKGKIGKEAPWANYTLKPDAFRFFGDTGPAGLAEFRGQIETALEDTGKKWKGPSWKAFVEALSRPETALYTTIITARQHSPDAVLAGLKILKDKGLISALPAKENIFAVGWTGLADTFKGRSGAESKTKVMLHLLDRIETQPVPQNAILVENREGTAKEKLHLWAFSDDDYENYSTALSVLTKEAAKKRWPHIKITLFYTGLNNAGHKACAEIVGQDGTTRPAFAQSPASTAAAAGIYSGSFDPPTLAHKAIIETALKEYPLGKLSILLKLDGQKDYQTSGYERRRMLEIMLAPHMTRVEIIPVLESGRQKIMDDIYDRAVSIGETPYLFAGEDSASRIPAGTAEKRLLRLVVFRRPGQEAPVAIPLRTEFVDIPGIKGVSATKARAALAGGDVNAASPFLDRNVLEYIEENGLYRKLPKSFYGIQEKFFADGFDKFAKDAASTMKLSGCSDFNRPAFQPARSALAWAEKFIITLVADCGMTHEQANDFWKRAWQDLLVTNSNPPQPKFNYILPLPGRKRSPVRIRNVKPLPPPKSPSREDYIMDIDSYVANAMPAPIRSLLKNAGAKTFLHTGTREETLQYHQGQGFPEFYRLITANHGRLTFLAHNPSTGQYRLVLSNLYGKDRLEHVQKLLNYLKIESILVEHETPAPVFTLSGGSADIRFSTGAYLMLGYKNFITYYAGEKFGHKCEDISVGEGMEIGVCTAKDGGKLYAAVRNIYGDDTREILEFFYGRGMRKFIFFGKAGGINRKLEPGDILLPASVKTPEGEVIPMRNLADESFGPLDTPGFRVIHGAREGWVSSIMDETAERIGAIEKSGVDAIDIEVRYMAEFCERKSDAQCSTMLFLSDMVAEKSLAFDVDNESSEKAGKSMKMAVAAVLDSLADSKPRASRVSVGAAD